MTDKNNKTLLICSCTKCDSASCFEKRNANREDICFCKECEIPLTCTYPPLKEINLTKSEAKVNKIVNKSKKYLSKEVVIKETIDTKKIKKSPQSGEQYFKLSYKDVSHGAEKENTKSKENCNTRTVTRVHSVTVNYINKGHINPATKLSAQVMELPLDKVKKSVGSNKTPIDNQFKYFDINNKIKEIYKACSCKVCECICKTSINDDSTFSFMPSYEHCEVCEPCDCVHSKKLYSKAFPHEGCPCIRCDRKDCKGVVKNEEDIRLNSVTSVCKCEPCQCIKCIDNFTKPCECISCACVDCQSHTIRLSKPATVVAAAVEYLRQNVCNCDPCECTNCSNHNYEVTSTLSAREISAGMLSLENCSCNPCSNNTCQINTSNCTCESNNQIIRKPTKRNDNEYDVRNAINVKHDPLYKALNQTLNAHATSKDIFKTMLHLSDNICNVANCKCLQCECIIHKDSESHENLCNKNKCLTLNEVNVCKCSPCECRICNKNKSEDNICFENYERNCFCEVCDCISCFSLLYNNKIEHKTDERVRSFTRKFQENNCKCKICKCTDCTHFKVSSLILNKYKNTDVDLLYENLYPIRKGRVLTPELYEANKCKLFNSKLLKKSGITAHKSSKPVSDDKYTQSTTTGIKSDLDTKKTVSFKKMKGNKTSNTEKKSIYFSDTIIDKMKSREINITETNNILANSMVQEKLSKSNSFIVAHHHQKNFHPKNIVVNLSIRESLNMLYDNTVSHSSNSTINESLRNLSNIEKNMENSTQDMEDTIMIRRAKQLVKGVDTFTQYLLEVLEKSQQDNQDFKSLYPKFYFVQNSIQSINKNNTNEIMMRSNETIIRKIKVIQPNLESRKPKEQGLPIDKISPFASQINLNPYNDASSQTVTWIRCIDKAVGFHKIEDLDDHFQIKYIVEQIVSYAINMSMFEQRNSANNRDHAPFSNKAKIIEMKSISDKAVLLRWTPPQKMDRVQGYELQVNGRTLPTILKPDRCMAVITCLPRKARVLISLRTITDSSTATTQPINNVIYCPNKLTDKNKQKIKS